MLPSTELHRCRFCGAPLRQPEPRVFRATCPYCAAETHLVRAEQDAAARQLEALQRAKEESLAIGQRAEVAREALQLKLEEAIARRDGPVALRHLEGVLRMAYAATVHLYLHGMPPEVAEPALQQIDTVVRDAVETFAREQGFAHEP